jgi:diaminopimelate epimerase
LKVHFYKYQATGNDFIMIDNRSGQFSFTIDQVKQLCHRKFGIGADGLMLIEKHPTLDFNLVYYNSDGSQSLCGNGSRAAVRMASALGMVNGKAKFNAYDGIHEADLLADEIVRLKMNDVSQIQSLKEDFFINTGSPHYIKFISSIEDYPVYQEGREIRYSDPYKPGGTNVNFVELLSENAIFVRTYERGVENETLSCGTGVTAAALAAHFKGYSSPVKIGTIGGELLVEFKPGQTDSLNGNSAAPDSNTGTSAAHASTFTDVFLIGPAKLVFEGDLEL